MKRCMFSMYRTMLTIGHRMTVNYSTYLTGLAAQNDIILSTVLIFSCQIFLLCKCPVNAAETDNILDARERTPTFFIFALCKNCPSRDYSVSLPNVTFHFASEVFSHLFLPGLSWTKVLWYRIYVTKPVHRHSNARTDTKCSRGDDCRHTHSNPTNKCRQRKDQR